MSFQTPYVIDGAEHSAALFRRALQTQNGGVEGVSQPKDFAVVPYRVPGKGVGVWRGDMLIKSRAPGRERETYHLSMTEIENVRLSGTGSSGARNDAIIVEVRDPAMPGVPDNPGEYARVRVIENVGNPRTIDDIPGMAGVTGYLLAVIEYGAANVGAVTWSMIRDCRKLTATPTSEVVWTVPRLDDYQTNEIYLNTYYDQGGEFFPGGEKTPNMFEVNIPEWATFMIVDARWIGVSLLSKYNPGGRYWMEYGDELRRYNGWPGKQAYEFKTQEFLFSSVMGSYPNEANTQNWLLMDTEPVPRKLRGKRATFAFKAALEGKGMSSTSVSMGSGGGLGCRITFAADTELPNQIELP